MWEQVALSLRESMGRVMTKIATLLPGIVAFVLVLVLFTLVGWALAWAVRKVLDGVHFDDRFEDRTSSIAELSPSQTPTLLVTRIVFWAVFVLGVLVGLSAFEAGSSELGISAYVFAYVPRVVGAVVLLFVGTGLARVLSRSILISGVNQGFQYARLLSGGVKWLVLVLTAAMVLDHLSIGGAIVDLAFGILFGGIVFALSLAIGLGSRDLVTRSLEREVARPGAPQVAVEEQVHHF